MAPKLKLPENFPVPTFGSSRKCHNWGKYLRVGSDKARNPFIPVGDGVCEDVTHVSEMPLEDSFPGSVPHFPSVSKATEVSPERPDLDIATLDKEKGVQKWHKIALSTITRRW